MKYLIITIVLIGISGPLFSQGNVEHTDIEFSAGASMLVYQSVYSYQASTAFEAAFRGNLTGLWDWQVGARLGIDPVLPDGFVRLLAAPEVGAWRPSVGVELGFTNRAHFGAGAKLMRETRTAMEKGISHMYIAGHSAPLSFMMWEEWRVSVLELHIGTHLGHTGRTVRVQVGLVSVGRTM